MRSRNLKPGFFANEILASCHPLARILFAGLWCMADREGRLEDRPKRIKALLLPYDDYDIQKLLDELADKKDACGRAEFISRYRSNGNSFIQIVNFTKHQHPHIKEPESTIPAPGEYSSCTVPEPEAHDISIVQEKGEHDASPADSLNLITDSNDSTLKSTSPLTQSGDLCPHQEIIALYHEFLPQLPRVKIWNQQRQKFLRQRWKEEMKRQDLAWWKDFFEFIRDKCPFLLGRNEKGWQADLEWIVRPNNIVKIIEGKYELK